jgi:tRNA U34 5-methylaminomethyl-2-thiouridine-forming methyltransferase MnmC
MQTEAKGSLEVKEDRKQRLIKNQKEDYERNLAQTREHGTIIMTIENLNKTLSDRLEQFIGKKEEQKNRKDNESIEVKAQRALVQLEVIEEFAILSKKFKEQYKTPPNKAEELSLLEKSNARTFLERIKEYLEKRPEDIQRLNI